MARLAGLRWRVSTSAAAGACFCVITKQPILHYGTDAAGRFLAVAVGDEDEWTGFDRYGVFVIDTADPARPPMTLDVSVPVTADGGERFTSMHVAGQTLLVDRHERYLHWDGTPEQRPAARIGFDLASGERRMDLVQATVVAAPVEAVPQTFSLGPTQPGFSPIADQVERIHGHRPECFLHGMRTATALLAAYQITEGQGVRHYLHVSREGTTASGLVRGRLAPATATFFGRFGLHAATAVFQPHTNDQLLVVPLSVPATRFYPVYMPLEAAAVIPFGPQITQWDRLPPAFHELLRTAPPMRRIPVQCFPGISTETAGGGFLVATLGVFLAPMLLLFLFELAAVLREALAEGRGRWEGPIVFSMPVLFLGACLWLAWRRWRRLRQIAERVRAGEVPCGLWLLERHLVYRDQVAQCTVLARQHIRAITVDFVGRTRQWVIIIDAPQRVFITVDAIHEFRGRAEALNQLLTDWWQDVGATS